MEHRKKDHEEKLRFALILVKGNVTLMSLVGTVITNQLKAKRSNATFVEFPREIKFHETQKVWIRKELI